jgi:cobalt-zinc-cadmium efflux system outer membrane protein
MDEAVRLAIQNNQQLRAQRFNVNQSMANEITAALKPNPVFASANEDFPVFSPNYLTLDTLRTAQEFNQSVSYLVERGGKRERRIDVARDNTDVTSKLVRDAERQLRFQVVQTFTNVLLAKSNLQFAQDSLKDFSQVVEINKRRLDAGDISEGDFLKIQLQQLQFEQDVSAAELALTQSKASLRQLLGYSGIPEDFDVKGELAYKQYPVNLDELQQQALSERPDLQAAISGLKLANDTVALAYANRTRDLIGETEYKRNGILNTLGFGLQIEIPIHNRNQGEIARSQAAVRQADESRMAAQYGVLTDVVNAFWSFRTNGHIVELYESGYLERATRSRDITNYAYRRGAASLLDLLDAERSYRAIQLAYRQALSAYMISSEQINFVIGRQVLQ